VALLSIFTFFVPIQVVLLRSGRPDIAALARYAMFLALVPAAVGMHRCKMYISRTFDMNVNDARKLVLASTARASTWHRTPASRRLIGYQTTSPTTVDPEVPRSRSLAVGSADNDSPTVA
jgi:hypothetical protein